MMFSQFVLQKNKISATQLDNVIQVSKFNKKKIGRLMVELGMLSSEELDSLLIDYLRPKNEKTFQQLKEMMSRIEIDSDESKYLNQHFAVLLKREVEKVVILTDSFSDEKIKGFESFFGTDIELKVADRSVIQLLKNSSGMNSSGKGNGDTLIVSRNLSDDEKLLEIDPYTKLIRNCFEAAKKARASDIHFENYDHEYLIRFRIHGKLADWKSLEIQHAMPITSRLKYILNMDLAIVGSPQDSRATLQTIGADIRANSMPVASGGEKIVLRLQYRDQTFNIRNLGLSDETVYVLLEQVGKSDGLILISGPTGSGKTTTLYALLEEMDRLGKNISTLENPVEKKLARINQANINDHKDFAEFQKALMRQDPDVILLGEIRDPDTASLGLKLSATGHLVLSTIHANGAVEVIDRLTNLGADLYSIKTNLRLSIAQRLVREICPYCSKEKIMDGKVFKETNLNGCSKCHQGVVGRIAIIEYLDKDDLKNLGNADLKVKHSIGDQCLNLAQLGKIDVKDALIYL